MKWGSAFKLAIKAFLFGLVWFVVGALLVVGGCSSSLPESEFLHSLQALWGSS